jgi:hypothetical protein
VEGEMDHPEEIVLELVEIKAGVAMYQAPKGWKIVEIQPMEPTVGPLHVRMVRTEPTKTP